jgi:hypothetical protein
MMKLLGQEEGDDMDTIDLDGMASFMLGRWMIAKDKKLGKSLRNQWHNINWYLTYHNYAMLIFFIKIRGFHIWLSWFINCMVFCIIKHREIIKKMQK